MLKDHRFVGETGALGTLLVPDPRPWEATIIGLDTRSLPTSYIPAMTEERVAPRGHSGVVLNFGTSGARPSALVFLVDTDGKPLPRGAQGVEEGGGQRFVVGDDGRAFLRDLGGDTSVSITLPNDLCRAHFTVVPDANRPAVMRGVVCQ